MSARRPKTFFRKNGYLPESAELELSVPPGFRSPGEFRAQLETALREREERHATERRTVVGAARVRGQSPLGRPTVREPRRALKPRVAARDKWKRIEALARLRTFVEEYREAWRAWTAGLRDTLFPAGTYGLRVTHAVCCQAVG